LEQLKEITRWQADLDDAFKQLRHDWITNRSLFGKDGETATMMEKMAITSAMCFGQSHISLRL